MADFRSGRRQLFSRVIEGTLYIAERKPCALCEWKISCYTMQHQRFQYIKEIACRFMASMLGLHGNVYGIKFWMWNIRLVPDSWHGKAAPVLDEWFSVVIRILVDITLNSTSKWWMATSNEDRTLL